MLIWVLVIMTYDSGYFKNKVGVDTVLFQTAEDCLKVSEKLENQLKKDHEQVYLHCNSQRIMKKKHG